MNFFRRPCHLWGMADTQKDSRQLVERSGNGPAIVTVNDERRPDLPSMVRPCRLGENTRSRVRVRAAPRHKMPPACRGQDR